MSKKNKKSLVPKLRFPKFRNDAPWSERPLDEFCERITEKVGETKLITVSITAGRGFVSQAEKFGRNIAGAQYKNYIFLRRGDFAYNKGNSNLYPQGCVYRLKEFDEVAASNAFICFRLKCGYTPGFFEGLFEKNAHGNQLIRFLTSGARSDGLLNIRPDEFFSVSFPIPSQFAEQQRIADCLSSLDELISAEGEKLKAYKDHKKALMQKLFPAEGQTVPQWRFPEFRGKGEWEEKPLGTIGHTINGLSGKSGDDFGNGQPFVTYKQVFDCPWIDFSKCGRVKISDDERQNILQQGDILFTTSSETPNEVGYASVLLNPPSEATFLNSFCFSLRPNCLRTLRPDFSCFLFHSPIYRKSVVVLAQGSTRFNISKSAFLELCLPIPKEKEQQKIADCLSSLDELITAQAQKVEALKAHKKGLMQGLFPSDDEVGE